MGESLKILVLEDSKADFLLLERHLKQSGMLVQCLHATRLEDLEHALERGGWDVVLSDYSIPEMNFLVNLNLIQSRMPDVPVILVSGSIGEEKAVELLKAGVWDFVLKDSLVRLAPTIERGLRDAAERRGRRAAEAALRESEARYRALVETTCDWIWEVDEQGKYTYVSPRVRDILGYAPEEVLGLTPFDLMPPEEARRVAALFGEIASARRPFSALENTNRSKDGRRVVLESSGAPVFGPGGAFKGYRGMDRDITGRKRAEEERDKLETQLRQAQKMEAIGQLAGGVAHDFNNLLTIILGYSDMLLTGLSSDDPDRACVADIRAAGERAAALTRQLLAFSRKQILEPKVLDLNAVVGDIEKMLRRLIGEDITLTTILSPGGSRVKVDPGQMEQVVINLAVNARDAMPRGGRLTIETHNFEMNEDFCSMHPGSRPGRYTLLTFTDTGCGMTPEVKDRIFEPFFTTKEKGKGTGLGLATVFGIIKQSEGYIDVCSEAGMGTCFKIYLPAVDAEAEKARVGQQVGAAPYGSETILLVEDEEGVRRFMKTALETHGYKVFEADNGRKALAVAQKVNQPIHLLITDVVMPEMSGQELVRKLHAHTPALKIMFMSGHTDEAVVRHGIVDAKAAYLNKPFTPLVLARKVREMLDARE